MPELTTASAVSRISCSLILQANLFQLFQPIGGRSPVRWAAKSGGSAAAAGPAGMVKKVAAAQQAAARPRRRVIVPPRARNSAQTHSTINTMEVTHVYGH